LSPRGVKWGLLDSNFRILGALLSIPATKEQKATRLLTGRDQGGKLLLNGFGHGASIEKDKCAFYGFAICRKVVRERRTGGGA